MKVFVGSISPEAGVLLKNYLDEFMPDATIEPLKASGIKGKIKNHAKRQDVALVIIDETLYQACVGVADDVLSLPKVHKYIDDNGLKQFLISKFGKLEESVIKDRVTPPDVLMKQEDVTTTVVDESDLGISDFGDDLQIRVTELENKLALSETMVKNLTLQLNDKSDVSAFVSRIKELEAQLSSKDAEIKAAGESSYVQLGKVARAEQLITDYEKLQQELSSVKESNSALEYDKNSLLGQVDELSKSLKDSTDSNTALTVEVNKLRGSVESYTSQIASLTSELQSKSSELTIVQDELAKNLLALKELELIQDEYDEKKLEWGSLSTDLETAKASLISVTSELTDTKTQLVSKSELCDSYKSELDIKAKQLLDANTKYLSIDSELKTYKKELEDLRSNYTIASDTLSKSDSTIADLTKALSDKETLILALETEKKESSDSLLSKVSDLQELVDAKTLKIANLEADLNEKLVEIVSLKDTCKDIEKQLDACKSSLKAKDEEIIGLKLEMSTLRMDLDKCKDYNDIKDRYNKLLLSSQQSTENVDALNIELSDIKDELTTLRAENLTLKDTNTSLTEELTKYTDEKQTYLDKIADLESSIDDLTVSLEDNDKLINSLRGTITSKSAEISRLIQTNDDKVEQLTSSHDSKTDKLNDLLVQKESDYNTLSDSYKESTDKIQALTLELESLTAEVAKLETENGDLKLKIESLSDDLSKERELSANYSDDKLRLESLNATIQKYKDEVSAKGSEIERLTTSLSEKTSELAKADSKITLLTDTIERNKKELSDNSDMQNQLIAEKRKVIKLEADLKAYKEKGEGVSDLKADLDATKAKIKSLEDDLRVARERCSQLELDSLDKEEQYAEYTNSVFAQMSNLVLPKVAYTINMPELRNIPPNICCIAGGSNESMVSVYKQLRKTAELNPNKSILVIDLVTDSYIDRELGVQNVTSPISWLNGADDFRPYIAKSRYNNVHVLSIALSYLNDLFLLGVDWQKRLESLSGYADRVIINIGCLSSLVSKVLFNNFSSVLKAHVVTKATPVNLRTVILNMTGLSNNSNVCINCVDFDVKSSKVMYQKLASKYNSRVLQANESISI